MSVRVEQLMRDYHQMVMERNCLENQIKQFNGISENEMINSMYFNNQKGERVQTSGVSDKTASIAIKYKGEMNKVNRGWLKHLKKRYRMLSDELIFFESAITSLSGNLPEIMYDLVINGLTWDELTLKYHVSRTMIAKYRKKAIHELKTLYTNHEKEVVDYMLS
jgi:hypothetical protein